MDNPVRVPVEIGTTLFTKTLSLLRTIEKLQREKDTKVAVGSAESPKNS